MRAYILPYITPDIETGDLAGDPQYYHNLALELATKIQSTGYAAWKLHPEGQGPAGILSLIYLFTTNQIAIIALNATLHAVAGLVLYLILQQWFSKIISFLASLPFIISPYEIHWFSQINKDSYASCGAILFVYGILHALKLIREDLRLKNLYGFLMFAGIGALLIFVVRPYLIMILQYLVTALFIIAFVISIFDQKRRYGVKRSLFTIIFIALFFASLTPLTHGAASDLTIERFTLLHGSACEDGPSPGHYPIVCKCLENSYAGWVQSNIVPRFISNKLRALFSQRCFFFIESYDQNPATRKSVIDSNIFPQSFFDAIAYLPRAGVIGIFSPLPSTWFYHPGKSFSVFYTIASIEVILFYISLTFLFIWALCFNHKIYFLGPVILCLCVMIVYGLGVPFIGALYRFRYPFWMIVHCSGVAALLTISLKYMQKLWDSVSHYDKPTFHV
jgi:putative peptidoglycan lipid II flippase